MAAGPCVWAVGTVLEHLGQAPGASKQALLLSSRLQLCCLILTYEEVPPTVKRTWNTPEVRRLPVMLLQTSRPKLGSSQAKFSEGPIVPSEMPVQGYGTDKAS